MKEWTYDDEHMAAARKIAEALDAARKTGDPVHEVQIIAQGIADFAEAAE